LWQKSHAHVAFEVTENCTHDFLRLQHLLEIFRVGVPNISPICGLLLASWCDSGNPGFIVRDNAVEKLTAFIVITLKGHCSSHSFLIVVVRQHVRHPTCGIKFPVMEVLVNNFVGQRSKHTREMFVSARNCESLFTRILAFTFAFKSSVTKEWSVLRSSSSTLALFL
jgi:hypothetical protein